MRWQVSMFLCLIVVLLGAATERARAQALVFDPGTQVAHSLEVEADGEKATIRFWLFVPEGFDPQSDEKLPFMLFLHGAGERGDELEQVKAWGPPKRVQEDREFPFIVVSPQCPKDKWWDPAQLIELTKRLQKLLPIDTDRCYITGLSMGGFGTWAILAKEPGVFAAGAPICGGGNPETAESLVETPIWAFHGGKDDVVPPERSEVMVEAVKAAGGEQIKYTLYPEANHNSWSKAYATQELYEWLLSHKLK